MKTAKERITGVEDARVNFTGDEGRRPVFLQGIDYVVWDMPLAQARELVAQIVEAVAEAEREQASHVRLSLDHKSIIARYLGLGPTFV